MNHSGRLLLEERTTVRESSDGEYIPGVESFNVFFYAVQWKKIAEIFKIFYKGYKKIGCIKMFLIKFIRKLGVNLPFLSLINIKRKIRSQ